MIAADPTRRIPAVRVPRGVPRPISTLDLELALSRADVRMRAWLLLMALAGLRCIEVAGLRPLDLEDTGAGVLMRLRECKGGGQATMPAHPAIVDALLSVPIRNGAWWGVQPEERVPAIFGVLQACGINATAHQLRHYAGSSWYKASKHDLLTTARLLRHADVSSTQIYAQLDPTRPAEVVGLVPRLRLAE